MPVDSSDSFDFDGCTPDQRERVLDGMHERAAALHLEQLRAVKAADDAEDWKADGMHSMADWLTYRYRMSGSNARAWVKAAHALPDMPKVAEQYQAGRISFDQLVQALSFAKPSDDSTLATLLPQVSAREATVMAKQARRIDAHDRDEAQRQTYLRLRPDRAGLGKHVKGYLSNDVAAVIEKGLERRAESMGRNPETGHWSPYETRLALGLHDLCEDDLTATNRRVGGDAHVVVVHAPVEVVQGDEDGGSATIDGEPIHEDTLQRLLCDTRIELHVDEPDGRTVGIGRASRNPPLWLCRRAFARDHGCCRWPGCSRPARHLHHMQHWSRGGATNASNLISVCWHHHHLLHEGGWEATGNADREVTFTSTLDRWLRSRAGPVAA